MKFSCFKMLDEVVLATCSVTVYKIKNKFSEEETEKLISLWSEEEVLFNCRHKEYSLGVELHANF